LSLVVILCLGLMSGTMIGVYYDINDILYALVYLSLAVIMKLLLFRIKDRKLEHVYTCMVICFFILGIVVGKGYSLHLFKDVSKLYGTKTEINGTITEHKGSKLVVESEGKKYTVFVTQPMEEPYFDNEIINVVGILEAHPKSQFNGDNDEYFQEGLHNNLGIFKSSKVTKIGYDNSLSLRRISTDFRNLINSRIDRYVDDNNKGLVKALVTGSTVYLEDEIKDNFANIGISHLVAVSGLHLGIFLSFFALLTVSASRKKWLKTLLTILIMLLYALIIGEKSSFFRSAIMVFVSIMLRRRAISTTPLVSLSVAGALICLLNPLYITDAGFMLSFCATLGLTIFANKFKHQYIAVPIIATLFLLPLTIYYYNMISPTCIIANLTILIFVPAIILFGYLSCLIPPLCVIVNILAKVITLMSSFMARANLLKFELPSPGIMQFAEWIFIILMVYNFLTYKRIKETLFIAFNFILFVCFCVVCIPHLTETEFHKVKVLNSGTYNTLHITTEDQNNVIINCGYDTVAYLEKSGIKELDIIIATEYNMLKPTEEVCKAVKVKTVILPLSLKEKKKDIESLKILYYNQLCPIIEHKDFNIWADHRIGYKSLIVSLYNNRICIPINTKKIDTKHSFSLMCVPNGCTDCEKYFSRLNCDIYLHPSYYYKYYDSPNKYITSKTGGLTIYFFRYKNPYILYK